MEDAMTGGWHLDSIEGVVVARCEALLDLPGIGHAFSTRVADGTLDFDLGSECAVDSRGASRHARFLRAAGLEGVAPMMPRQVHGRRVVRLQEGHVVEEADGVFASVADARFGAPAVKSADCVPILVAERQGNAVAAVHAGWRGTAAGVVVVAVEALARLGFPPADLIVALGAAIRPCCYEVGAEVVEAVSEASGDRAGFAARATREGRFRVDLHAANRMQLESAGVKAASIEAAPWCTHCRGDLFFSFRRDGKAAGRMMAALGWRPAGTTRGRR